MATECGWMVLELISSRHHPPNQAQPTSDRVAVKLGYVREVCHAFSEMSMCTESIAIALGDIWEVGSANKLHKLQSRFQSRKGDIPPKLCSYLQPSLI